MHGEGSENGEGRKDPEHNKEDDSDDEKGTKKRKKAFSHCAVKTRENGDGC